MELNDFQKQCNATNLMPNDTLYHIFGIFSELGELLDYYHTNDPAIDVFLDDLIAVCQSAGILKKMMRDEGKTVRAYSIGQYPTVTMEALDILWYSVGILSSLNMDLEKGAALLREKLYSRKERNMLHGSGDKR